ncbi:MAG: AraC family transcriptional regulator [Burkholderiales bacterium]
MQTHTVVAYLSGRATMRHRFGERELVGEVAPGHIAVKDVDSIGHWSWHGDTLSAFNVFITPALIQRVATEMYGPGIGRLQLRDSIGERDDEVTHLLHALAQESASSEHGTDVMLQALGRQLAVLLIRRHTDLPPSGSTQMAGFDPSRRQRITQFIASNLGNPLSVALLARQEGLSVDRFSRLFRQSFDCAPHQYVMKARIQRARELLACQDLSLADIACETGFADQSHLTRHFKRCFGTPPRQWRSLQAPQT